MDFKVITISGEDIGVSECGSIRRFSKGGRWRCAGEYISNGGPRPDGYFVMNIKGAPHYIHRLVAEAWAGNIPEGMQVHHIDGDRSNNSMSNLEIMSATDHQLITSRDSSSHYIGVSRSKNAGKWEAYLKVGGKKRHVGLFDSAEDAARARDKERYKHYPDDLGFYNFKPPMVL